MIENLTTDEIFTVLNSIKQNIGLAVCAFTNNKVKRNISINNMEFRFDNIVQVVDQYYYDKQVKNVIKISIQINENSDIRYWNDKKRLETLKIDLAHKFDIPLKCVEVIIDS